MIMQQHMLVSNSVIIHLHLKNFCAEEYLKQLQAPLASRSKSRPSQLDLMLLFSFLHRLQRTLPQ